MHPPSLTSLTIDNGTCYAVFAYDIGWAIDLEDVNRRITADRERSRLRHKTRAPQYFEYRPAPLRLMQEGGSLAVGQYQSSPTVEVMVYDFGAVIITYRFRLDGPFEGLLKLSESLYENEPLLTESRKRVEQLLQAIHPSIERPKIAREDEQLDTALDEGYAALARKPHLLPLPGSHDRDTTHIAQLQVDGALLFERVTNTLKLLGDQYLARVYRLASQRFHLEAWDASILRKLETLESIYGKMSARATTRRMEVLEWIIIVLIAVSIALSFFPMGGHEYRRISGIMQGIIETLDCKIRSCTMGAGEVKRPSWCRWFTPARVAGISLR